jgi:hypothetical protein
MGKIKGTKSISLLLGMLLCLSLIQSSFAQPDVPEGNVTSENTTYDVGIQAQPNIELQTSYISDAIEPGKEYVYLIKIKNIADKDITIDPKVTRSNIYDVLYNEPAFSDDVVEISAPSTIKAGEVTNMTIRVPVPENATGSYYNGNIDLNVNGEKNNASTPQVNLYFTIGKEPTVPFVKTFNTISKDPITIEVSYSSYDPMGLRISPKMEKPDIKLGLTHDSIPVNIMLVKSVESGYIGANFYPQWAIENGNIYQESANSHTETYKVPGAIGNWELTILPKNVTGITYSITVGDIDLKK